MRYLKRYLIKFKCGKCRTFRTFIVHSSFVHSLTKLWLSYLNKQKRGVVTEAQILQSARERASLSARQSHDADRPTQIGGSGWGCFYLRATEQWNHVLDTAVVPPNQQKLIDKLSKWGAAHLLPSANIDLTLTACEGLRVFVCGRQRVRGALSSGWLDGTARNFSKQNITSPK